MTSIKQLKLLLAHKKIRVSGYTLTSLYRTLDVRMVVNANDCQVKAEIAHLLLLRAFTTTELGAVACGTKLIHGLKQEFKKTTEYEFNANQHSTATNKHSTTTN